MAQAVQQRGGYVRAARAGCPRVSGVSGDAIFSDDAVIDSLLRCSKNGDRPTVIFRVVRTSVRVPCMFLTPFTPLCTRVCVV